MTRRLDRTTIPVVVPALVLVVLVVVGTFPLGAAPAAAQEPRAERVLLVTAPTLRWADLAEHDLPEVEAFLARSSVALMSLRTIGARTGLGEGYITMGTGNRASARSEAAGLALEPDERFEAGTAAEAYERRTGLRPTADILHLGFPSIVQTNDRFLYGAEPGILGAALAAEGRTAAVVANGDAGRRLVPAPVAGDPSEGSDGEGAGGEDEGEETVVDGGEEPGVVADGDDEGPLFGEVDLGRSAALVVVDDTGQVPLGHVDHLLTTDPDAPYGVRYDEQAVVDAVADVWERADVVVVELSDLDRADAYRREADPEAAEALWVDALHASDQLFGRLLEVAAEPGTTVILASPSAPRSAESLGVFAISDGAPEAGIAQSGTTRRPGYVTLPDIGPTILDRLGIDRPAAMTGTIIATVDDADVGPDRFESFARATDRALFRDAATGPVSVVFVAIQILAYGLAVVAVSRRRRWVKPVSYLALVVLATPTVGFLAGVVGVSGGSLATFGLGIFGGAILLALVAEAAAMLVARWFPRTRALVAPLSLVALAWFVLVVDVVTGGRLQIDTVFGYSPVVAGRFAGFGNLAFAVVAVGAVVVACGGWAVYCLARGSADGNARLRGPAAVVMTLFLAATVVIDGAPAWGSDVGGVLATVPAFTVVVLVAMGVGIGWRRGLLIAGGTVVVLGIFAALDLARAEEDRTHLGRLVARIVDDGAGGFLDVIQRKLNTNINILTSSIWTLTIPFALGLMLVLTRRRKGFLRDLQEDVPGIRPMLIGGLLVAVLGFALNDSGVAVPAMMFAVLLPYLTYVLLRWRPAPS